MITSRNLRNILNLNSEFIENDLNASFAIASYNREMKNVNEPQYSNYSKFAATLFRRAAAHSLLLNTLFEERDSLFWQATSAYIELGSPYSNMMNIFITGNRSQDILKYSRFTPNNENKEGDSIEIESQATYSLIANIFSQDRELRRNLEIYRRTPIGVLGIPVGTYLNLYDALNSLTVIERRSTKIEQAIYEFIGHYDRALPLARSNKYHWERLALPFHPAEPDIFSVLLYVHQALKAQGDKNSIKRYFRKNIFSEDTLFLLNGILADYL